MLKVSFFEGPIWNTTPAIEAVGLEHVYATITQDEQLRVRTQEMRRHGNLERMKRLLPYVTPHGTFRDRRNEGLVALSGIISIDIDHLPSTAEAERIRDAVFCDPQLDALLCYVSPSGRGVKCLLHKEIDPDSLAAVQLLYSREDAVACMAEWVKADIEQAQHYINDRYAPDHIDWSCTDLARACYLCHDRGARVRQ